MNGERKLWEQMVDEGEPVLWFERFTRFRLMYPKRSIVDVFLEEEVKNTRGEEIRGKPRTEAPGHWYEEAKKWRWKERVAAWDAHWIAEQDEIIEEERARVLRTGFAVQHRRIQELDRLVNKLIEMTEDEDKVWVPDVKAIGNGPNAQRVDLVNFNAPLFTLIRGYQADIAAEMGERVKKKDITVTEMPPNVLTGFDPDQDGVDQD